MIEILIQIIILMVLLELTLMVVGKIKQKDIFSNLKFGITNLKSNDLLSGSILYDESRYEFLFNSSTSGYLTILEKIGEKVSIYIS